MFACIGTLYLCVCTVCMCVSARNKDQKLVGHFFEDRIFYRLTVPLKMYRKLGQPKWILVGQMLKIVQKMTNGQLLFLALCAHAHCSDNYNSQLLDICRDKYHVCQTIMRYRG